jgi:fructan beta-fructosidase
MTIKITYLIAILGMLIFSTGCQTAQEEKITTPKAYKEQHRPQFHFSPKEKWMNDPNGMVYYDGEYHLFYQYYPDSNVWGPMHWAHAVSTDLTHWEHLPIALEPDSLGYIFSGSAVIDWKNTTGFGSLENPAMVAIYTYHLPTDKKGQTVNFQYQAIAYSLDKGRTWTKYKGNPVIPNDEKIKDFRDPKVFWHEESAQWCMIFAIGDRVRIYNSKDLKSWTLASEFGKGFSIKALPWECPDLFELPIEGTDEKKWVMLLSIGNGGEETGPNGGSATQYFVGDFDGKTFKSDNPKETTLWVDYGRDNYAGVTWSGIPKEDGRRLFLGWMSNWDYAQVVPTTIWRSAMTLPRVLSLKKTEQGLRLKAEPVKELEQLRRKKVEVDQSRYGFLKDSKLVMNDGTGVVEVFAEFELPKNTKANFGIELKNASQETYRIGYDAATDHYFSNRTNAGKIDFSEKFAPRVHLAPRKTKGNTIQLHCYFDVASAEMFTDDGTTVMTDIFFPTDDFIQINVFSDGDGGVHLKHFKFYQLESIWK